MKRFEIYESNGDKFIRIFFKENSKSPITYMLDDKDIKNISKKKFDRIGERYMLKERMDRKNKTILLEEKDSDKVEKAFNVLSTLRDSIESAKTEISMSIPFHFQEFYGDELDDIRKKLTDASAMIEKLGVDIHKKIKQ